MITHLHFVTISSLIFLADGMEQGWKQSHLGWEPGVTSEKEM